MHLFGYLRIRAGASKQAENPPHWGTTYSHVYALIPVEACTETNSHPVQVTHVYIRAVSSFAL